MAGQPSVYFTLPSWNVLKFPPDPLPPVLPPPLAERSFRSPFGIEPWFYNAVLHPAVPFTFASAYILIVLWVNAYNNSRGNKPWWISKQKPWQLFVVIHNILLALYSAATFAAMFRAISHTLPDLAADAGAAGIADALCKLHGPRILGDAVTFNSTINIWESKNHLIRLTGAGNPDPTDVGRLWNEGLAYWGWLFYISKFYEVLDTLIIVAKGKRSPTLQTYHHAGAMLCMWAGIRYMSPPIWMFVFVNSAIHAMMYVYFALAALDIRVPQGVKRTLTSLQIAQFIFGATYAGLHLFVAYDIPVSTPYKVAAKIAAAASSASSAFTSATSVVSAAIESPTVPRPLGLFIKKLLLRAAGEEGPAERIGIPSDRPVAEVIEEKLEHAREVIHQPIWETKYRTELTRINCIDTSGEAFAIWLNLLYLAPLTVLFARFFVRAYLTRGKPATAKEAVRQVADDAKIAEAQTERTMEEAGKRAEKAVQNKGKVAQDEIKKLLDKLRADIRRLKKENSSVRKINDRIEDFEKQVKQVANKATERLKNTASEYADKANDVKDQAKATASDYADKAKDAKDQAKATASDYADKAKATTAEYADKAQDQLEETLDSELSPDPSSPGEKKKKKKKNKNKNHGGSHAETADESEEKQDAVLAATEPTRPGPGDEDSDAMGKSGVNIKPT